ncbi:hypothetical protein SORBI_3003G001600 [Sorghum bicolor]|uniref:Uncharacterized protein n=2 Tax=Sorghum bicolor TaxID=4558 RepID=A0A1B6Q0J4_SORBI|nr:hypothetical protein SORBI_3003G001600 [Sorghum bicolor]
MGRPREVGLVACPSLTTRTIPLHRFPRLRQTARGVRALFSFFLKKENIIPAATMTSNLIRLRERDRASSEAENLPPPQPADGHHCAAFPHAGRPHHHRVHGPARHWCRCANAGIQLDLPTSGRLGLQEAVRGDGLGRWSYVVNAAGAAVKPREGCRSAAPSRLSRSSTRCRPSIEVLLGDVVASKYSLVLRFVKGQFGEFQVNL